ncbi:MAG TPA: hypothetical protein VL752_07140 [Acidisoma sp.]|jgi:hypothetical protein|uniref:hypothetical protein n=1 Tax=Acidisoma sp. TaxID=1872115 RepID=UPI002BBBCE78|nr:hypothetical protein [Acidisoma sp.]HTI00703.1 hypothetical protein [Acidisoma sp.]
MTTRYQDAIDDKRLDGAARRLLDLLAHPTPISPDDLAIAIVREMFCSCVSDEPDASQGHLASIHTAIAAEVVARAQSFADAGPPAGDDDRRIDIASQDSFPASDPPSWIYAS